MRSWKYIEFENGSNPFICTSGRKWNELCIKYKMEKIRDNMYYARERK